jgi:hypothetical protein
MMWRRKFNLKLIAKGLIEARIEWIVPVHSRCRQMRAKLLIQWEVSATRRESHNEDNALEFYMKIFHFNFTCSAQYAVPEYNNRNQSLLCDKQHSLSHVECRIHWRSLKEKGENKTIECGANEKIVKNITKIKPRVDWSMMS